MSQLLDKLDVLLTEVIGLVKEERVRRNCSPWGIGEKVIYGPRGTEIKVGGNGILDTPVIE